MKNVKYTIQFVPVLALVIFFFVQCSGQKPKTDTKEIVSRVKTVDEPEIYDESFPLPIKKSEKMKELISSVPELNFPVNASEVVVKYLERDSIVIGETTFFYLSNIKDSLTVNAYSSETFDVNNFCRNAEVSFATVSNWVDSPDKEYKVPLAYAEDKEGIVVLYLHLPEGIEYIFQSYDVSAVFYNKAGKLVTGNDSSSVVSAYSVATIDASLITVNSIISSSSQIDVYHTILTEDRAFEDIFGNGENLDSIPLYSIHDMVFDVSISSDGKREVKTGDVNKEFF